MKIINKAILSLFLTVTLTSCNGFISPTRTIPTDIMETAMSTVKTAAAETQAAIPTPTFTSPSPTKTPLPTFTPSPVPLIPNSIFDSFPPPFVYNTIKTAFGVVQPNATVEEQVVIDSSIGEVIFSLYWEGGDLDLGIVEPEGSRSSSSLWEELSDSESEVYSMKAPPPGIWTMRIFGKSTPVIGKKYTLRVTAHLAGTSQSFGTDKKEYFAGDVIKITGSIKDGVSGSLLSGPAYIYGVTMKVTVEDPEKNEYHFELYDDGLHEDGKANDGIYGNVFSDTKIIGKYNYYIQISGLNNRAKQPFTREYFGIATVR